MSHYAGNAPGRFKNYWERRIKYANETKLRWNQVIHLQKICNVVSDTDIIQLVQQSYGKALQQG